MSKLSIYETSWIDLVFQYRNKEYGAYQLRRESAKTSITALLVGIAVVISALSIPLILHSINPQSTIKLPDITTTVLAVSEIIPNQLESIEKQILPQLKKEETAVAITSDQLTNPEIVKAEQATPDIAKNTQNIPVASITTDHSGSTGLNPSTASGSGIEKATEADPGNAIVASVALDKLPEFPGGINKFYTYVGNNFEKPEIEVGNTIRVYVSFVIEKDGTMTDIQVKRDPGFGLGKEAIRVLMSLKTKWSPGMIGSKPVRTAYNLPITVQMD